LIVFIDDATSRLTALRFVPVESPWAYTAPAELDDTLARREERTLTKAVTFGSGGTKYCVNTGGLGTALRGAVVTLHHFVGGVMTFHYKDRILAVTAYGTYPVPDPAEDEKTLDERVDRIVGKEARLAATRKILAAA
jgi:hypothetical protein